MSAWEQMPSQWHGHYAFLDSLKMQIERIRYCEAREQTQELCVNHKREYLLILVSQPAPTVFKNNSAYKVQSFIPENYHRVRFVCWLVLLFICM